MLKAPQKIVDHNPGATIYENDIVTFKKTDFSRGAKKGEIATVVDMVDFETKGYTVLTQNGETDRFKRHEFRIATTEDIARHQTELAKKQAKSEAQAASAKTQTEPPEMPEWLE